MRFWCAGLWTVLLLGCPGKGGGPADGSVDSGPVDAGIDWPDPPASPAAVDPPDLTPCPAGWNEVSSTGPPVTCDPWPAGGPGDCTGNEAHFAGTAGCARVGPPCPTGDFPTVSGPARYVLAGASGGDGTEALPFGTIGEALATAPAGTVVVIGKGSYDEALVLPAGVTLEGACVDGVELTASTSAIRTGVVSTSSPGGVVRNLRIGSSAREGITVQAGGTLTLENIVVEGATQVGVRVTGGTLIATDLVVRGTVSSATQGYGLHVDAGGTVTMARVVFDENRRVGVFVEGVNTSLDLEAFVVRDTQPATLDDAFGRGLYVTFGATLVAREGVVYRNREAGLFVSDSASVTLEHVVVQDTLAQLSNGVFGRGISASSGTTLVVRKGVFERNRMQGVLLEQAGTSGTLEDVVIRDTLPNDADRLSGQGLEVRLGASVSLRRVVVSGNRSFGVVVYGDGTTTADHLVVRGTLPDQSDQTLGIGFVAFGGQTVELRNILVEDNFAGGMSANDPGTSMLLEDVVIRRTLPQARDGRLGRGLNLGDGSVTIALRLVIEDSHEHGIFVRDPFTTLVIEDGVIRGTRPQQSDSNYGRGINIEAGALVTLTRVSIENNHSIGVMAAHEFTSLRMDHVLIADSKPRTSDQRFGRALNVQEGATATVTHTVIERSREIGVLVAGPGTSVQFENVIVRDVDSDSSVGDAGRGISVQGGAVASLVSTRVERSREHGIVAVGAGTTVTLDNVQIVDVAQARCAPSCPVGPGGTALSTNLGASVVASRFLFTGAVLCGVQVAGSGSLDLTDGEVSGCAIGACVQVNGYDLDRLTSGVRYVDNETNLDSTQLPVPQAADTSL